MIRSARRSAAARVITDMQRGQSLHLHYEHGRSQWRLSDGTAVSEGIAKKVVAHDCVVGANDSLFRTMPSQTRRFIE